MAVVLSQLLRHSDNHGNSLKKSFLRKMTFQSVTHTGGPIGVEATTFRLLNCPDTLPLSYKRLVGAKARFK